MTHRLACSAIPVSTVLLATGIVILSLPRTVERPTAPAATFSVLTQGQRDPLLGTDDTGRRYLLQEQGDQVCLETVPEDDAADGIHTHGVCGVPESMRSSVWWDVVETDEGRYLWVLVPDEYADAKVVASGTGRLVLREHNLRVFQLRPGTAVTVTLRSASYRDLTAEVPRNF